MLPSAPCDTRRTTENMAMKSTFPRSSFSPCFISTTSWLGQFSQIPQRASKKSSTSTGEEWDRLTGCVCTCVRAHTQGDTNCVHACKNSSVHLCLPEVHQSYISHFRAVIPDGDGSATAAELWPLLPTRRDMEDQPSRVKLQRALKMPAVGVMEPCAASPWYCHASTWCADWC